MMSEPLPPSAKTFLLGRWISSAGNWMALTAAGWWVVEEIKYGSSAYAALRLLAGIGAALFAAVTGPVLKRANTVRVLVSTALICAILSGLSAAIVFASPKWTDAHWTSLCYGFVLVLCFVSGAAGAFIESAEQRFQAVIVPEHQQRRLERDWTVAYYIGRVIFGLGSGIVLTLWGTSVLFLLDSASFIALAISAVLASRLVANNAASFGPVIRAKRKLLRAGFEALLDGVRNYRAGFVAISKKPHLALPLVWLLAIEGIGFVALPLLPEIVATDLKGTKLDFGLAICFSGLGGLAGMLIFYHFVTRNPRHGRAMVLASTLICPLGLLGASLSTTPLVLCAFYAAALLGWSWLMPAIRITFRMDDEGPLVTSIQTLVLLGICRVLQVLVVMLLIGHLQKRALDALFIAACTSLGLVLLMRIFFWRLSQETVAHMFPDTPVPRLGPVVAEGAEEGDVT